MMDEVEGDINNTIHLNHTTITCTTQLDNVTGNKSLGNKKKNDACNSVYIFYAENDMNRCIHIDVCQRYIIITTSNIPLFVCVSLPVIDSG